MTAATERPAEVDQWYTVVGIIKTVSRITGSYSRLPIDFLPPVVVVVVVVVVE